MTTEQQKAKALADFESVIETMLGKNYPLFKAEIQNKIIENVLREMAKEGFDIVAGHSIAVCRVLTEIDKAAPIADKTAALLAASQQMLQIIEEAGIETAFILTPKILKWLPRWKEAIKQAEAGQ